jgi:hypothetical protein
VEDRAGQPAGPTLEDGAGRIADRSALCINQDVFHGVGHRFLEVSAGIPQIQGKLLDRTAHGM